MFENSNGSVKEAMPNTEVVAKGSFEGRDVRALDIAKRLTGYNFHPPANYFPLIVHEALMIEPTETENKDALDRFADALIKIAEKAILYGSHAKGNYKNESDIDLTLRGRGLTLNVLYKIMDELDDLLLPYIIDLSILDQISDPDVIEHIQRVGVTFYEKGEFIPEPA